MGQSNKKRNPLISPFFFLGLYGQICLRHTNARSVVEFLPGFEGPLPFELETGYVGVDEGEDLQVFYYLTKSESNPKADPLLFWMTGGPGCSPLSALLYEIGPLMFKGIEYHGSLPTLIYNPNSWTKMASIVYIDLPVGTGFTYRKSGGAPHCTDLQLFDHAYEFIRKWLRDHPEFSSSPVYIGGDSVVGLHVPIITQLISNGKKVGVEQFGNLKGYILGNPVTYTNPLRNYRFEFAHGMGLISDELYESMKMNCKGEYRKEYIDPNNIPCLSDNKAFDECLNGILFASILDPECGFAPPIPPTSTRKRSALDEGINELNNAKGSYFASPCENDKFRLAFYWANDNGVQDALHIRKGRIGEWQHCNRKTLTITVLDVRSYHASLSKDGYRALIYSGDHDMIIPHQSTQSWIKILNYAIVDEWRSWKVNDQIAGYTRTYSNNMTFATIKGGSHVAAENMPEECCSMFKRWISHEPL